MADVSAPRLAIDQVSTPPDTVVVPVLGEIVVFCSAKFDARATGTETLVWAPAVPLETVTW